LAIQVLIISHDIVDARMAGPGIRYWQFAHALSREFDVTLAVPQQHTDLTSSRFHILLYRPDQPQTIEPALEAAEVVVAGGYLLRDFPLLMAMDKPLVIDAYTPYLFEALEVYSLLQSPDRLEAHEHTLGVLSAQFVAGDFFLCANERQRDLWLGFLAAHGRINPYTYLEDKTLHRLIEVVPFGLPSEPPRHKKQVLKGVCGNIGQDDQVLLWGGGLWQWLDPLTLIRAMARVVEKRQDVKLVFPGTRHPYKERVPDMEIRQQTLQLSQELGLTGRYTFFGEWVDYEEWPNYLLEADIGISLHLDTVETRFAFRTRILDYIWAGLPIVATRGDAMAEIIEGYGLGRLVDPQDVDQLAQVLLALLEESDLRQAYRPNFSEAAKQFTWERVVEPLIRFCRHPRRAPDKVALGKGELYDRLAAFERVLRTREGQLIAGLEQHARNLESILKERDRHIHNLEEMIREREKHIRNLEALLRSREEELQANQDELSRYKRTIFFNLYTWLTRSGGQEAG
jgi:glycosyltransferase involved in cell wall biosynthesis